MRVKHSYSPLVEVTEVLDLLIGLRVFIVNERELATARATLESAMPYSPFTDKDYVTRHRIQGIGRDLSAS